MGYQWKIKGKSMIPVLYMLLCLILMAAIWVTLAFLVTSVTAAAAVSTGKATTIDLLIPLFCLFLAWGFTATVRGTASMTLHVMLTDDRLEYRTLTKRLSVSLTDIGTLRLLKSRVSFWDRLLFKTKRTPFILEIQGYDKTWLKRVRASLPNAAFVLFQESLKTAYPASDIE